MEYPGSFEFDINLVIKRRLTGGASRADPTE